MRAAILALAVLCPLAVQAQVAAPRAEVPINQTVLSDGTIRYSIPVQIGSQTVETMLDTGSTGLRVLTAGVDAANYQESGEDSPNYSFGSGVVLHGGIAHAKITIGGLAPDDTTDFQLVKSVDCEPRVPKCPASRISAEDYRIGGDGIAKQGFYAIMGVSVPLPHSRTHVPNPLAAIAASWIITLPKPGDSAPGKLVLNPTAEERAGFTMLPLPRVPVGVTTFTDIGGFGNAIPGCLVREDTKHAFCGGVVLDTGAMVVIVNTPVVSQMLIWPEGTRGTFAFGDSTGIKLAATFSVGSNPATSVRLIPPQRGVPDNLVQAGVLPFFVFSALYDPGAQQIGLMAR